MFQKILRGDSVSQNLTSQAEDEAAEEEVVVMEEKEEGAVIVDNTRAQEDKNNPEATKRHRLNRKRVAADRALDEITKTLGRIQKEDAADIFGKNVAFKLRVMSSMQRLHAEKLINDILFAGQIGSLNFHSTLTGTI